MSACGIRPTFDPLGVETLIWSAAALLSQYVQVHFLAPPSNLELVDRTAGTLTLQNPPACRAPISSRQIKARKVVMLLPPGLRILAHTAVPTALTTAQQLTGLVEGHQPAAHHVDR